MLFSVKLEKEIYAPWKAQYINYEKLKKHLKENVYYQPTSDNDGNKRGNVKDKWTEKNESDFVHQLDLELEKVYSFQTNQYKELDARISSLENLIDNNIDDTAINSVASNNNNNNSNSTFLANFDYKKFQNDLEESLSLAQELDHFARVNFTGFVKIVKKHDRLHSQYTVKPLLNVRLNELPFHSEDYSPLLYRISILYNFLRENFSNKIVASSSVNSMTLNSVSSNKAISTAAAAAVAGAQSKKSFKSFKFWIHPDNLMEVKTKILRHLPVLIYNNNRLGTDGDVSENDSIITSLYFDNANFDLYNSKLQKNNNSPTLRLRWSGRLIEKPDIFLERKLFHDNDEQGHENLDIGDNGDTGAGAADDIGDLEGGADEGDADALRNNNDTNEDVSQSNEKLISIQLKEKYINSFIFNNDSISINKIINKMVKRGDDSQSIKKFKNNIKTLQHFINEGELEPALRCVYTRTAFQIPGDDRVRIIIDSDILFIREDSFDKYRPIRDPQQWHRTDIDSKIDNPYSLLRKGEYAKFPYSVMEITVQEQGDVGGGMSKLGTQLSSSSAAVGNSLLSPNAASNNDHQHNKIKLSFTRKSGKWIEELASSHLVKEVPNFSKFIQGIASLYTEDDRLDILPFWLPELEKDIRKDPKEAYDEELQKLQQRKHSTSLINKINRLSPQLAAASGSKNQQQQGSNVAAGTAGKRSKKGTSVSASGDADLEDYDSSDNEEELFGALNDDDEDSEFEDSDFEPDLGSSTAVASSSAAGLTEGRRTASLQTDGTSRTSRSSNQGSLTSRNYTGNMSHRHQQHHHRGQRSSKLVDIESEDEEVVLPPGVKEPKSFIKNAGPVKVEAKVWLANERTFIRWLHTAVIMFLFSTSIQASSYKSNFPKINETVSGIYFLITLFTLGWGYYVYKHRLQVIQSRDGAHLDNMVGPLVIAVALLFVLIINFSTGLQKSLVHHELGPKLKELKDGEITKEYFRFFAKHVAGVEIE